MESLPDQQRPFRMCDACGRLTPTNAPWCVECGAASVQALAEEKSRRDEQRFAEAFFARGTFMTWALLGANLAVFALMMSYTDGDIRARTPAYDLALVNFGAKVNSLIDSGEYWRLVTPIFIHIGIIHLAINMYSLYVVGQQVERLYGAARCAILYLVTGIAGVVASYLYSPGAVSAGASGAIFGLVGVLFSFGIRYRNELPGVFRKAFGVGVLPTILLNLWIGYAIPGIDNYAHIGGLVVGAILAFVLPYARPGERRAPAVWWVIAGMGIAGALGCFALAAAAPPRTERDLALMGQSSRDPAAQFVNAYNTSSKALTRAFALLEEIEDGEPVDQAARSELTEQAGLAIEQARGAAGLDTRSKELLGRQADLLERAVRLLDGDRRRELTAKSLAELGREGEQLGRDWKAWAQGEGKRFGLTFTEEQDNKGSPA
jgi:membrane associated rhomboid family serine protease